MKSKKVGVVLIAICMILLVGTALLIALIAKRNSETADVESVTSSVRTFADWTTQEVFQDVPAMIVEGTQVTEPLDVGDKTYLINVNGTVKEDFDAYLVTLEEGGFTKYADNGENGIGGAVYNAIYTKEKLVVNVTHMVKINKTYIYASNGLPLSEHLNYKDEYVANNVEGAETTLHLMELYDRGTSFVLQLKNKHFIVIDGGLNNDAFYLLDYLEKLAPNGEKPVVEAWFFSHAHGDHMGALQEMVENSECLNRILVNGFYYNDPSQEVFQELGASAVKKTYISMAASRLKTEDGKNPEVYVPQAGQRYYFNDISIEIAFSQDAYHKSNIGTDVNDTSTWCVYNIEGQKFMEIGDAATGSISAVKRIYDSEYFDLDMYAVSHHGINVYDDFTDFLSYETLIYPCYRVGSIYYEIAKYACVEQNAYMLAKAKEAYGFGNGTVVFTFPYAVGTADVLAPTDWIYHKDVEREYEIPRAEEWEAKVVNE